MAVVNDKKAALKKLKLLAYNGKSEVEVFRQKLDDAFKVTFLPNHVECSDYKYGDEFTIKMISLRDSGYNTLNALERDAIETYGAYANGYNKTRGNSD